MEYDTGVRLDRIIWLLERIYENTSETIEEEDSKEKPKTKVRIDDD